MTLHIRPATLTGIPALREMLVATWHATYDATLGAEKVDEIAAYWHSNDKLTAEFAEADANLADHALLVADDAGALVGTASAHLTSCGRLDLARLYIAPHRQGAGLGTALFRAVLARFPAARTLRLEVEPRNAKAIHFYTQLGLVAIATGSACSGDTKAAIAHLIMEATLPVLDLRPARDSDAQDLFGLMALCFAEYPGCFVDPHDDMPDLVTPGQWKMREKNGHTLGGEFLVLEDQTGRVCACIAVDFPEGNSAIAADKAGAGSSNLQSGQIMRAELHRLYVRPDMRGGGIARSMITRVEQIARAAGAGGVMMWSDTRFTTAHRLYESLAYTRGMKRPLGDISNSVEYFFEKSWV